MTLTEHIQPLLDKRLPAALVVLSAIVFAPHALRADNYAPAHIAPIVNTDTLLPDRDGLADVRSGGNEAELARIIAQVFHEAYEPDVVARVYIGAVMPGADEIAFVRKRGSRYSVVGLEASQWLYPYTTFARTQGYRPRPEDYRKIKIARCDASVDEMLGNRLVELWRRMLLQTRSHSYGDNSGPADDTWLYYSMPVEKRILTGTIWSSFKSPRVQKLNEIAWKMIEFCRTRKKSVNTELENSTIDLTAMLKPELRK